DCTGPGGSCALRWARSIQTSSSGRHAMDELTMIRELLDEPAPSDRVVAEGRERLYAASARPARRARRVTSRTALALAVTGAIGAVALAAATLGTDGGSSSGAGRAPVVTGGSARSVLLAAAVQAAAAPTHGTYWHVRSMSRTTLPRLFGHGANRYRLRQPSGPPERAAQARRPGARPRTLRA